jgi:hypothetical protein
MVKFLRRLISPSPKPTVSVPVDVSGVFNSRTFQEPLNPYFELGMLSAFWSREMHHNWSFELQPNSGTTDEQLRQFAVGWMSTNSHPKLCLSKELSLSPIRSSPYTVETQVPIKNGHTTKLSDGNIQIFTTLREGGFTRYLLTKLSEHGVALSSIGLTLNSSGLDMSRTHRPSSTILFNPSQPQTSSLLSLQPSGIDWDTRRQMYNVYGS